MPRIVSPKTPADSVPEPKTEELVSPEVAIEARMDEILKVLHRMDRRDRVRTVLSTFKTILTLIPIIIFLASTLYLYYYGDDLIKQITEQTAQSAAEYSEGSMTNFLEQFNQYLPKR